MIATVSMMIVIAAMVVTTAVMVATSVSATIRRVLSSRIRRKRQSLAADLQRIGSQQSSVANTCPNHLDGVTNVRHKALISQKLGRA
jgi:hypothetical protein